MSQLYIAEKPSLALAIATALGADLKHNGVYYEGEGFKVTWLYGHVFRLGNPEDHSQDYKKWSLESLPMDWPITHIPSDEHLGHIKAIVKEIKAAQVIVNAGDNDEEGCRLVDEIIEYAGINPDDALRILINDNNPAEILKAKAAMQSNKNFRGMSESALARAVCDQRFGFNLTRLYTLLARKKGVDSVLSVGRCQSPILWLVVSRDRAHEAHTKQFYFNVHADIAVDGLDVEATYLPVDTDPLDDSGRINDKSFSDTLAKFVVGKPADVVSVVTKLKKVSPPLPHNLLSLQAEAAGKFGFKPSKTLAITQSLRETYQAVTYNRSESRYLVEDRHQEAPELIALLAGALPDLAGGCDPEIKSKAFNSSKVTSHHAIIPTSSVPDLSKLSDDEEAIYLLIAKNYLAQFYNPETYNTTTAIFSIENHQFKTTGRVVLDSGWRVLFSDEIDSDDDRRLNIEAIEQGDKGIVSDGEVTEHVTKPPSRYTMKTLLLDLTRVSKYVTDPVIKKLLIAKDSDKEHESGGIGTPATRDSHIETLFTRGFIREDKKSIISTSVGREFHDLLPDFVVKPDLTALWHEKQEQIENGTLNYQSLIADVDKIIADEVKRAIDLGLDIKTDALPCPSCDDGYIVSRLNHKKERFWSCTTYPDCKQTYPDDDNKPDLEGKKQEKGKSCKECGDGFMLRKKGASGFFWGCSNYPNCKTTLQDKKGKPVKKKKAKLSNHPCPDCDEKLIRRESAKSSAKNSHWWGCSGFPSCKFKAIDKDGSPVIKSNKKDKKG